MIDNEYLKMMANYNKWQNDSIYSAGDQLSDDSRKLDRGAFFRSIHHTLCHLLWGDMIWTSRFAGLNGPDVNSIHQSSEMIDDWGELKSLRQQRDLDIISWAGKLENGLITGDLSWYSGAVKADVTRPLGEILVHFFNHQTHHRGQVHAMITAAGGRPDDTDLFVMSIR
jgi:uncharacterized damage-inducible protein DinB